MEFDTRVKLAIYQHFAETGHAPSLTQVSRRVVSDLASVRESYQRLR
jgi:hypothetical protein